MLSQQRVRLDRDEKRIILALLLHPRLIAIRRQFQVLVSEVLRDRGELERISQASQVPMNTLIDRAPPMLMAMGHERASETSGFGEMADVAVAFFASPRFVNLWGHFTMALQKIMIDDVTVGEVAAAGGARHNDQVRSAIRQFSSTESVDHRCPADAD